MTTVNQIKTWTNDLAVAMGALRDRDYDRLEHAESHQTKRSILRISSRLKTHLAEPTDFIQHLASQVRRIKQALILKDFDKLSKIQLLACLRWLVEFQVLACIPLTGTILMNDVADLAVVPETQLCRVVHMTATVGFLHEPRIRHIAHTPLSASFVTNLSFLDATVFLAETAATSALHMTTPTNQDGQKEATGDSAYMRAFNTSQPFAFACTERSRLQRQWSAYRRCAGEFEDCLTDILRRLNWRSLGNACVVEVCAKSAEAATTLAENHPSLHFIVQLAASSATGNDIPDTNNVLESVHPRVTVQSRRPAATQTVTDAALYVLHLPPSTASSADITAELNAHLPVLRANFSSTLILAPPILPEPGSVEPDVEIMARLHDLTRLQLFNETALELDVLIDIISSVRDASSGLVVVNKLRSGDNATAALGVRYQAYGSSGELRDGYVEVQRTESL